MSFFLLSHVMHHKGVDIYGPVQVLERFLKKRKQKTYTAYLPLLFDGWYQQIGKKNSSKVVKNFKNIFHKYLYDIFFSTQFILKNTPQHSDIVIAVDPLNCVGAIFLKLFFNYRIIYYTADFSDKRFDQNFLNGIYHFLDKFCLFFCDENWCVSERIVEKRYEQGRKSGVVFVPNTPVLPEFNTQIQDENLKNKLLYVGSIDTQMNIFPIIEAVQQLNKKKKRVTLTLIGGGQLQAELEILLKKKKLDKWITYLGPQENGVVIENIQKHGIGVALYSGGHLWNQYGDSMKIREYQYFGLPVITTEIPSNSQEIIKYNCGVILNSKTLSTSKIINAVLKIQSEFETFTKNAYSVTELRKKEKILSKLLDQYMERKK